MIWNKEYINVYLSARKSLNQENIESLSAKQIDHIGKLYKEESYDHFKKKVFLRWFSENKANSQSFIRRTNKLLKKLSVELTDKEKEKINNLLPREFTARRAMKTIETPYKDDKKANLLENVAYFFYKDVRVYKQDNLLFKQLHKGEMWISKNEIVFYNRDDNSIDKIINFKAIQKVTLRKHAVEMNIEGEKIPTFLRYKDNELIFISLNRSLPQRVNVDFLNVSREESDTAERTIEHILNL